MNAQETITYPFIIKKAWPIILANAAVPLLGLVDTAVIGNQGTAQELGAIALGAMVFSFIYWSFGFLRMGTTGFVAQAAGAKEEDELRAILGRGLLLGLAISVILLLLQVPLGNIAFSLISGSQAVEDVARGYFDIRIWGAPATLASYCLFGVLIGLGESRKLLAVQLLLNGLNALLDILFAGYFEMGAEGIALGTVLAEWSAALASLVIVTRTLKKRNPDCVFWVRDLIFDGSKIWKMMAANVDILIRTLALVFAFAFFTNRSAQYGDTLLAANHILLQFVSFSAFFLDGYAFVAESLVGRALGAKDRRAFDLAVKRSSLVALWTSLLLAFGIFAFGDFATSLLTDLTEVRFEAQGLMWLVVIYVALGFAAFQLDGIFIGATQTKEMRNASVLSTLGFLGVSYGLEGAFGIEGIWGAFIFYVGLRAVTLGWYFPRLRQRLS